MAEVARVERTVYSVPGTGGARGAQAESSLSTGFPAALSANFCRRFSSCLFFLAKSRWRFSNW